MSSYGFPCIVKYEGLEVGDIEDGISSYIVLKKQPFYTTLAICGRPGFFSNSTTKISLNYYDLFQRAVSLDKVTFVSTFPIEYKSRVNAEGTELEIEAIVYALSSQHQGRLFSVIIEVIENVGQYRHIVATVPLKVVSKSDSLSATLATPEGHKTTIAEMLGTSLNQIELSEIQSTKALMTLCKMTGIPYACDNLDNARKKRVELGELLQRLCMEYRQLPKTQRVHRLHCELAALMDEDLALLSTVNEAFCESFQRAFDANYELLLTRVKC
jgi:hypothetical protein